jgi:Zn-dependent M28 family amino/carboxypeptidase
LLDGVLVDSATLRGIVLHVSMRADRATSHRHRSRLAWPAAALAVLLTACGATVTPTPTAPAPSALALIPGDSAGASLAAPRIDAAGIRTHLLALEAIAEANGGVRTAGTAGYDRSVEYVAGTLRDLGYAVQTPEFEMATFLEEPGASIRIGGGAAFVGGPDFHAMIYSATGELTARIAEVGFGTDEDGGCEASDFTGFPRGAIAVAPAGPCFRRDVVLNAVDAGAAALVVSYAQWSTGAVRRPTLLSPDGIEIPALSASREVGGALRAAADAGAEVTISVHTEIGSAMIRNVIAESRAAGDRVVMLGGHLDSVHDGPGINDNGSGVAALLEVADVMAEQQPSMRVRFAFWGGEEFGLFGSGAYVEALGSAERAEIAAYLNFDMLGSPNYVPLVYDSPSAAAGSQAIADFLVRYLGELGIGAEARDLGAASDHASFDDVGIPTGGIFSGASEIKSAAEAANFGGTADAPMDACYHLACDTVANVRIDLVAAFAEAALTLTLAIASGGLPLS